MQQIIYLRWNWTLNLYTPLLLDWHPGKWFSPHPPSYHPKWMGSNVPCLKQPVTIMTLANKYWNDSANRNIKQLVFALKTKSPTQAVSVSIEEHKNRIQSNNKHHNQQPHLLSVWNLITCSLLTLLDWFGCEVIISIEKWSFSDQEVLNLQDFFHSWHCSHKGKFYPHSFKSSWIKS